MKMRKMLFHLLWPMLSWLYVFLQLITSQFSAIVSNAHTKIWDNKSKYKNGKGSMKILKGNSGNSVLLAVVKAFTTVSGILSTMIMSHALSLELYGTFSQTNLIVTTATNITALGLVDAVNYFYNRSNDEKVQKAYINTIMGFQTITGIVAGILIIVLSNNLVEYFNNPMLSSFFWLIAFRPLFANLNVSLQYLQVSIGKAKSVAIRNAGFATLRLVVYAIAAWILKDITVVLIAFWYLK